MDLSESTQKALSKILAQMNQGPLSQQAINQIKSSVDYIFFQSNYKQQPSLQIVPESAVNSSQGFKHMNQTHGSISPLQNQTLQGMNFQIGSENNTNTHHNQKLNIKEQHSDEENEDFETQTPFQMHMNIKFNKQLAQSNQGALK